MSGTGDQRDTEDRAARILAPSAKDYWAKVVAPALSSIADDGYLATFLNGQIEHFEAYADDPDGDPAAIADKIAVLEAVLEIVKLRIRARIAAAERTLGTLAQEAA